ncbi:MAG: TetR/AcrR family transcriptional regulator [Hyphomonadaceae bacterium]|nr:TetR/AcrR family transcriptional regulator [Hyphomonadaceae bacterium]
MAKSQKRRAALVKLSRNDWIREAGREIAYGGIGAVNVNTIARNLGVTKGSFYWHFETRDDLLQAFLAEWREQETLSVIDNIEKEGGTHRRRLERLAALAVRDIEPMLLAGRQELFVREWAIQDELAQKAVESVDRLRTHYLVQLFVGMGLARMRAVLHANLLYTCLLGQMLIPEGSKDRALVIRQMVKHLLDAAEAECAKRS